MRIERVLAAMLVVAVAGCKDPTVQPPRRRPVEDAQRRVARHLLRERPSDLPFPANVTLGGGVLRYLGTRVDPPMPAAGRTVRVAHYFEPLRRLDASWKLFVHVQPADGPGMLVNADHVPVGDLHPTDRWQPGTIVEDVYTLTVPADAPSEIVGYIGFYRGDDRLPVDAPAAHDGANRIPAFHLKVAGQASPLPVYRAPRLAGPVTIDGRLDDAAWKTVPSTGAFARTNDGGPAHGRAEAKLAWDDQALYVAFEVEDEDVWAKLEKHDEPIYGEEVVEVFLDADGDGRTYNELEVSPRNVQFDAYFPARRQGMALGWSAGMTSAVQVQGTLNDPSDEDRGWTAELRVPVANLMAVPAWPPRPGDRWRFNLYRLEWHSGRRVNEGSAFSPPFVGDFHHLPRFGYLEFGP